MHSSNDLNDGYLGSGKYLRCSIRKHGKEHFKVEILEHCKNRQQLNECEKKHVTKKLVQDKYCMNLQLGGEGFNSVGMATVRDEFGNCFNVFIDDPRYLSGELVGATKNRLNVYDETGEVKKIYKNDPRYLSGEFKNINVDTVIVRGVNKCYRVNRDDPRYLSGELVGATKNTVLVKDVNGKTYNVKKDNPKYLSGEFVPFWKGKQHTEITKKRISKTHQERGLQLGEKNSQYGTVWVYSLSKLLNKKIPKNELESYIANGWIKGRKIKEFM